MSKFEKKRIIYLLIFIYIIINYYKFLIKIKIMIRKNVLINDIDPMKKTNINKKRLIISSSVVYYFDKPNNNKKKVIHRRNLSDFILPDSNNISQNTFANEILSESKTQSEFVSNSTSYYNYNDDSSNTNYRKKSRSYDKNICYIKYNKKLNKLNQYSSWRVPVIELDKLSIDYIKKFKEKKKEVEKEMYNIKKVIIIQSFFRMYRLRKNIFDNLMNFYKKGAAGSKIFNIVLNYCKNLFSNVIRNIKLFRKHKYYINKEENELLIELHNSNIYNIKDVINFFNNLLKLGNIDISNINNNTQSPINQNIYTSNNNYTSWSLNSEI